MHWKNNYSFNYFCKTVHLKSLREFLSMCQFSICQGSEYSKNINMPGFWISSVIQGWPIFVNMSRFWVFQDCHYTKASEFLGLHRLAYFRKYDSVLNMCRDAIEEGFWKSQNCEHVIFQHIQSLRFWISLIKLFWLWQSHEFDWLKFHRVLNMLPVLNIQRLRIWPGWLYEGHSGLWISLDKSEYALIMPQYEGI